jgi:S1-C subfamily serine protease
MSTRKTTVFYALLIAVASLAVGMVIASRLDLSPESSAQTMAVPAANSAPLTGPLTASTFRDIAKAVTPTVVNIRTESRQRTQEMTDFFGGGDDNRGGGIGMLFGWLLAPIAAAVIQMAVSRSREYQADESGAYLSHDPAALASALRKLEVATKQVPAPASVSPAEAHLFIMNPLAGRRGAGFGNLFSTHPPTEQRIERLQAIARDLGTQIA